MYIFDIKSGSGSWGVRMMNRFSKSEMTDEGGELKYINSLIAQMMIDHDSINLVESLKLRHNDLVAEGIFTFYIYYLLFITIRIILL